MIEKQATKCYSRHPQNKPPVYNPAMGRMENCIQSMLKCCGGSELMKVSVVALKEAVSIMEETF